MMKTYYKLSELYFENTLKPNNIVIASDYNIKGSKCYTIKDINKLDIRDDRNLYEIIQDEKPVKLFFDLEFSTNPEIVLPLFDKKLKEFYMKTFNEELETPIILNSGYKIDKKEHSLHYIYNTGKYFKNIYVLGSFIQELTNFVDNIKDLKYKNHKGQEKFIFDTGIYNRNRCFRLPYQSKKGQSFRRLNPVNYDDLYDNGLITDLYVCNYDDKPIIYDYDEVKYVNNLNNKFHNKKQIKQYISNKNPSLTNILFRLKNIPQIKDRQFKVINSVEELLLSIPNKDKYYQDRNVWLFIGTLCKTLGIDIKVFNKWTGKNELKNYDIFYDTKKDDFTLKRTFNTLLKISKVFLEY